MSSDSGNRQGTGPAQLPRDRPRELLPRLHCKTADREGAGGGIQGLDRSTTDDTREKERLGKLWEERSGGQCYFEMVKGPGELGKIQNVIKRAAAG